MHCSLLLKDPACIFLCEIFVLETNSYTAEQVADMIMNDGIGEMDSAASLDEESSSNDEPFSQSEFNSSSNTDPEFHGR